MFCWIALLGALAQQSTDAREAEMFGSSTPVDEPQEPATPSADREADMFAEPSATRPSPPTSSEPAAPSPGFSQTLSSTLLQQADDALALGGQLFLRFNGAFREDTAAGDAAVSSPSLLDAFADVRPSDRVRAYAQLRFTFDSTVAPGEKNLLGIEQKPFDLQLAQAWAKFDLGRVAYVTAGRQRIRWGTGRFWNPTDFINQEIRNSIDFFDQRVGVDIVKVHFPFEALGWNLYLIGTLDGLDTLGQTGLAARAEFVFGEAEVALSSFVKDEAPLRFGADVSAGIWLFDVKGEAVLSRGLGRKLFRGALDFEGGEFPEEVDTDEEWYFQGVVGLEGSFKISDTDTLSVGAEYFYNQAGYDDADIYPFLFLNQGFVPLYTGRHYFAVYAFAQGPFDFDDLNLTASTLGNLSDASFLSRFDVQYILLQYVTLNAFVAGHWGSVGEFRLGLDIPPVPSVPQLADGFTLANEVVDVGVAVRVAF